MTTDCEPTITNMPMVQSFEVMSGLFDIRRVCAVELVRNLMAHGDAREGK